MQSSTQVLVDLLLLLFGSAVEMRMFVRSLASTEQLDRELPDNTVSPEQMAHAMVARLKAHGSLESEFFAGLLALRPRYATKIRAVAALFELPGGAPPANPRYRRMLARPVVWVLAGGLLGTSAYLVAVTQGEGEGTQARNHPGGDEPSRSGAGKGAETLAESSEVFPLSDSEADPITLRLVSRREGRAWRVAVSRHREASATAEALFYKFLLRNARDDERAREYLGTAEFKLCQGSHCYSDAIVGESVTPDGDVFIQFHVPEHAALNPGGPRPPDRHAAVGLEEFNESFNGAGAKIVPPDIDAPGGWIESLDEPWVMVATMTVRSVATPAQRKGLAPLKFRISLCPDGAISGVEQIQGTGDATVDESLVRLLGSTQLPPPPESLARQLSGCPRIPYVFTAEEG